MHLLAFRELSVGPFSGRISINTADRHVSNILTKIGASNRAEAASFAVRQGIA